MLSLVMLTKNSGERVGKVLRQAKLYADKIYIFVDNSTTDNTVEVCREYADYIELVDSPGYIEPLLSYMYSVPDTEWILRLDDDETVGDFIENKDDILSAGADAIWMPRYAMVDRTTALIGKPMYPDCQLRLFKKGCVVPNDEIHVSPMARGTEKRIQCHIFHWKFMLKGKKEREELAAHYDSIRIGSGTSPQYREHQVPEEYYRGQIGVVAEWPHDIDDVTLNLGSGKHPYKYALNIDSVDVRKWYPKAYEDIDFLQCDLNEIPWPINSGTQDVVVMCDTLEHLKADSLDIFNELWRILRPGGIVRIKCPDASQPGVFQDMTHVKFFIKDSFYHLDPDHLYGQEFNHYTPYKWRVIRSDDVEIPGAISVWLKKRGDHVQV